MDLLIAIVCNIWINSLQLLFITSCIINNGIKKSHTQFSFEFFYAIYENNQINHNKTNCIRKVCKSNGVKWSWNKNKKLWINHVQRIRCQFRKFAQFCILTHLTSWIRYRNGSRRRKINNIGMCGILFCNYNGSLKIQYTHTRTHAWCWLLSEIEWRCGLEEKVQAGEKMRFHFFLVVNWFYYTCIRLNYTYIYKFYHSHQLNSPLPRNFIQHWTMVS